MPDRHTLRSAIPDSPSARTITLVVHPFGRADLPLRRARGPELMRLAGKMMCAGIFEHHSTTVLQSCLSKTLDP